MFLAFESRFSKAQLLHELRAACQWAEVLHGRAAQYVSLIEEFFGGEGGIAEHVLACYEAFDIVTVYHQWKDRVATFPGLMENYVVG